MSQQTRVSLGWLAVLIVCVAGFLLTKTTALDGLLRVAALVVYGASS